MKFENMQNWSKILFFLICFILKARKESIEESDIIVFLNLFFLIILHVDRNQLSFFVV